MKNYRPLAHFTAPKGWINDPNGLIYFNDKYHLFYQHNPFGTGWDKMHWGHAISEDLIHWEHLPIALKPDTPYDDSSFGGCYSGSAIEHEGKMALFYTGCIKKDDKEYQTQNLAFSNDGISFIKYENNPIIAFPPDGYSNQFRDPKVWKHNDLWYMVLGCSIQNKGCVLLYISNDFYKWEFRKVLLFAEADQGDMWECPDFFEIDGKFVLTVSVMNSAAYQNMWFIGDFDYSTEVFEVKNFGEIDYGKDFYAPQSFLNKHAERILFAWADSRALKSGLTKDVFSKIDNWCGSLCIPRKLSVYNGCLSQQLVDELVCNKELLYNANALLAQGEFINVEFQNDLLLIELEIEKTAAHDVFELVLTFDNTQIVPITINFSMQNIAIDLDKTKHCQGIKQGGFSNCSKIDIQLLVDKTSIELFADNGTCCFSCNIFRETPEIHMLLASIDGNTNIKSCAVYKI